MKLFVRLTLFSFLALGSNLIQAQAPQKISYQMVVVDENNLLVINQSLGVELQILQGNASGTAVYTETHTAITNGNGLLSLELGGGTTSDNFASIDWSNGPYFIETNIDLAGGTSYTLTGTSELQSVPYALHAASYAETDPSFAASAASGISAGNISTWNAKQDALTAGTGITISGNVISASGGSGSLPAGAAANDLVTYDGTNWVAAGLVLANTGSNQSFSIIQPSLTLVYCIAIEGLYPSQSAVEPYIGEIAIYPYNHVPQDWLECNGALLQTNQFAALFYLLGATFGGNGSTTFALPDLRGRTVVGRDQSAVNGATFIRGTAYGSTTRTLNVTNLPAHSHSISYQ